MKYFTPDLHLKLQLPGSVDMDAADAEWEAAEAAYEHHLAAIRNKLPSSSLKLLNGLRLHDAEILWMGQAGPFFAILLAVEPHHNPTVLLTYRTVGTFKFRAGDVSGNGRSAPMLWMYDEVDVGSQATSFRHSFLFSDGSELELEASEVQITTVDTIYSPTTSCKVPA